MKMRDLIRLTEMPDVPRISGRRPDRGVAMANRGAARVLNATEVKPFYATGPQGSIEVGTVNSIDDEIVYFTRSLHIHVEQPHPSLVIWIRRNFAQFLKSGSYAGTPFVPDQNDQAVMTMGRYAGDYLFDYCVEEMPTLVHLTDRASFAADVMRESQARPNDVVVMPYSADTLTDDDELLFIPMLRNLNLVIRRFPQIDIEVITVPAAYVSYSNGE